MYCRASATLSIKSSSPIVTIADIRATLPGLATTCDKRPIAPNCRSPYVRPAVADKRNDSVTLVEDRPGAAQHVARRAMIDSQLRTSGVNAEWVLQRMDS